MRPVWFDKLYKSEKIKDLIDTLFKLGEDKVISLCNDGNEILFKTSYDRGDSEDRFLEHIFKHHHDVYSKMFKRELRHVWFVRVCMTSPVLDIWVNDDNKGDAISLGYGSNLTYEYDEIGANEKRITALLIDVINKLLELKSMFYEEFLSQLPNKAITRSHDAY
jgi:hypothetical protein